MAIKWSANAPAGGGLYFSGQNFLNKGIKKGDVVTVSVWQKCSAAKDTGVMRVEFMDSAIYSYRPKLSTGWQQYIVTGKANKDVVSDALAVAITFYYGSAMKSGDTLYLSSPKVEKGNMATDWTPAPEDYVSFVDVEYYLSTSATSLSGGSWSTTAPTWVNGKYMWSRTVTTDGAGNKTYSPNQNGVCIAGAQGATGAKGDKGDKGETGATGGTGATGNGVKSIVEQYYKSTSATSLSGGSWSTTYPGWENGKYIWTRSVITYTNNTTSTTTPVCVTGTKGDTGATGKGVKSTAVTYQVSSSGTSVPTGTWSSSVPSASAGQYLWTRTIMTYTDNTTSTLYSVGKMGTNGTNGATGSQGYSLVANVVRDAFTESQWTRYGTINREETWSSTSGIRNGCRVGDMFAIVGTATDTKNAHVAYYRSNTASGDLKGLCISHTIIPRGATGATGPQGPQGVKGEADIKCYQLTGGTNQLVWSKLGTLTSAGNNSNFIIDIYTGSGYNGQASQNSQAEIVIKDGWQASASTTAAFGVSVTRQNCDDLKVQVRATASNQCDVWVYLPWSYSWGTYTVAGKYTSWATSQTTQTAEPTTGTLQDLAYRMNPENAAKVATNFLEFTSGTGLQVGNKTNGSWSGYRTKISASAFEILNQAGTTLAYYGDKLIQLGKNAKDAVIELCGGVGKIKVDTSPGGSAALSIQSEYVDIKGVHEAVVETSSSTGSCIAGAVDDTFVVNTYSDANNKANINVCNGSVILESKKNGYQAEVEFYGCGWSGGAYTGAFAPTKEYSEKIMLGDSGRVWERLIVKNSPQVTSDRRSKTNIFPLGKSQINETDIHSELFDRLKPVQYRMIDGDGRICYGFVAQDVVEAMRELGIREDELDLVHHDRKNTEDSYIDTYSMVYTNLIAIITHELQLEKQRRSNLEIEIADLRSELESMRDNISGDTN